MPKGEHTGKRGPKPKPEADKRTVDFVVKSTPANHAKFLKAGGSSWAYRILLAALDEASPSRTDQEP